MKINMNDSVKVKLTDVGVAYLEKEHKDRQLYYPSIGEFKLNLDADGFYKTQMWSLMNTFGHLYTMGGELPFETEIFLINR